MILDCGIRAVWSRALKHLTDDNHGLRLGDFKELNRIMRVPHTSAKMAVATGGGEVPSTSLTVHGREQSLH